MLNMIEMTKTEGWARLANWQDAPGHTVRLCVESGSVDVHIIDTQDRYQASGAARGPFTSLDAVVDSAFVAMGRRMREVAIEAEVRAEVERRMLDQASGTERAATDSERDGRAAE